MDEDRTEELRVLVEEGFGPSVDWLQNELTERGLLDARSVGTAAAMVVNLILDNLSLAIVDKGGKDESLRSD